MAPKTGWVKASRERDRWLVEIGGRWDIDTARHLDADLRAALADGGRQPPPGVVQFDLRALEALDSSGAWLLCRAERRLAARGIRTAFEGARPADAALLERVARSGERGVGGRRAGAVLARLVAAPLGLAGRVGRGTLLALAKGRDLISFVGLTVLVTLRVLAMPWRIRVTALFSHVEQVGFNAIPIVGLLAFLIGVVIAFQGADQLKRFGAEIFTVNLLGVSILREMGIVLTAIVVAGRSGSAFTAQIGTMKVNQEIDAMITIGLDPIEVLVLPRLFALVIALPLLAFYADIMALVGGAVMSLVVLDISPTQFINQLHEAVTLTTFLVGIVKAPVFAFLIALVGCFEGLKVEGSAESVGRLTTASVVESIFLVITFDALFSVLYSVLGV